MKQIFYSLVLLVLFLQGVAYCQNLDKPILMAELQGDFVEVDISEYLYRINIKAVYYFNKSPNGVIAVRVCSAEPLPIAMFFGVDNPLNNVPYFNEKYFEPSKNSFEREKKTEIYFLRTNKNCKSYKRGFPTQWWFVPEDADFPEFIEYRKFGEIDYNELVFTNWEATDDTLQPFSINNELLSGQKDSELNSKTFESVKLQIAKLLKQNKTAFLLIKTPNPTRLRKIINPRAIELKTFLNKQGIGNHRIFIRKCSWCFNSIYYSKSKNLFPEVSIIYQ